MLAAVIYWLGSLVMWGGQLDNTENVLRTWQSYSESVTGFLSDLQDNLGVYDITAGCDIREINVISHNFSTVHNWLDEQLL